MTTIVLLIILIVLAAIINGYIIYRFFTDQNKRGIFCRYTYLDANGTTCPYQESINAMRDAACLGNMSGIYAEKAHRITKKADDMVRKWAQIPYGGKIIYTSGASESVNTILRAIIDAAPRGSIPHIITSAYEHKTALECLRKQGNRVEYSLIRPTNQGFILAEQVTAAIQPNTVMVSIMHINNEIGTINDITKIFGAVKAANPVILTHTDAVQSFGKIPPQMIGQNIDAFSASFHKFGGPQGIGILALSARAAALVLQHPLIAGTQFGGMRGGTENVPAIAGGVAALKRTITDRAEKNIHAEKLREFLIEKLAAIPQINIKYYHEYSDKPENYSPPLRIAPNGKPIYEAVLMGPTDRKMMTPNTIMFSLVKTGAPTDGDHFCNIKFRNEMFKRGIVISIGSACSGNKSHVLEAIGAPAIIRCGAIRISFGEFNRRVDVSHFIRELKRYIKNN